MLKPCLGAPGNRCGRLIRGIGPRCVDCARAYQRARDLKRGTAAQRGYNAEYMRNRALVLADGPHGCAWGCGRVATTVDHRIPLARGGTNDVENLMPCCALCNSSRGSRVDFTPPQGGRW